MKKTAIKILPNNYRSDEQKKTRFDELYKYFNNPYNKYIQFDGYYLSTNYHEKSGGIRWFHGNKWQVEVVVDMVEGPSQNIAPFSLFSNLEDAIINMVLIEEKAIVEVNKQRKLSELEKAV